ncbi:MAG: AraC family transcriptional regulator [Bacteroidota bacterium]
MISLPFRLLDLPNVTVWQQDAHGFLLQKKVEQALIERRSYLGLHAISMVLRGKQIIQNEAGGQVQIEAGSLGIMSKGIYTISDLMPEQGAFESILFFFDQARLDELIAYREAGEEREPAAFFQTVFAPSVNVFVEALQQILPSMPALPNDYMKLKLQELLLLLWQQPAAEDFLQSLRARNPQQNLQSLLEQHYDKALRVEDYAYLSGRSVSSFRRDVQRLYGTTPQKWLIEKRLHKAQDLLQAGQVSVREVAESVGYEQVSHFIKAFKARFQRTPGEVLTQKHHA